MKQLIGFAVGFLLLTCLACDDGPSDTENHQDETVETSLANFALAYSEMDSARYARYLDADYRFYPYPDDLDPSMPDPWWDREEEMAIAGRMFGGSASDNGYRVQAIELDFLLKHVEEDTTDYQERTDGEVWYRVTAAANLLIQATDLEATGDDTLTNFVMGCDQVLTLRRDPGGSGRFVVFRQTEGTGSDKSERGAGWMVATEGCWGRIKQSFRTGGEPFGTFLDEFERAYSSMDSVAYASLLDSSFQFELLPEEVDPSFPEPSWDRSEELAIAGRMFHQRSGRDGITVTSIQLDLGLVTAVEDTTHESEGPAGATRYEVTARVDLSVGADDPGDPDGGGFVKFTVRSNQIFVIRPDPGGPGGYVVLRQKDQHPLPKQGEVLPPGVEGTSWGAVKSLFRSP